MENGEIEVFKSISKCWLPCMQLCMVHYRVSVALYATLHSALPSVGCLVPKVRDTITECRLPCIESSGYRHRVSVALYRKFGRPSPSIGSNVPKIRDTITEYRLPCTESSGYYHRVSVALYRKFGILSPSVGCKPLENIWNHKRINSNYICEQWVILAFEYSY